MDKKLKRELSNKISDAKSVIVFMFNADGTEQAFISGDGFEIMATIASEMKKIPGVKAMIEGAAQLYNEQGKQLLNGDK